MLDINNSIIPTLKYKRVRGFSVQMKLCRKVKNACRKPTVFPEGTKPEPRREIFLEPILLEG